MCSHQSCTNANEPLEHLCLIIFHKANTQYLLATMVVDRTMVRQVLTLTFRAAIFSRMKLNALRFSSERVFMWQVHPRLRPRLLYRLLDSSRAISPDVWFGPAGQHRILVWRTFNCCTNESLTNSSKGIFNDKEVFFFPFNYMYSVLITELMHHIITAIRINIITLLLLICQTLSCF